MNQHSALVPILSVQGLRPSERQHLRPPGPGVPCHRRRVGDGLGACTGRSQLGPPSALPASALTGKPHGLIVKRLRTNMKDSWQIRPGALCFDLVNCHRSVSFSSQINRWPRKHQLRGRGPGGAGPSPEPSACICLWHVRCRLR